MPPYEWPEHRDLPESEHPAHGEGSDESPMIVGLGGVYTNNSSVRVTVDSGASGMDTAAHATWLSHNSNLILSMGELLEVEPFPPAPPPITAVAFERADTTRYRANPSSRRTMELHCGKRRS